MKVLIVDDNINKAGKLAKVLSEEGIGRGDIEIVHCAMNARTRLKEERFDLLVIDLLLPLREENTPELNTALNLIKEITERDVYFKPSNIVGFTAYTDEVIEANSAFNQRMWTIVSYDPTTNAWETQFRHMAHYLVKSLNQSIPLHYRTDICVVTALQIEIDAVYRLPWAWEEPEPLDDSTFIRRASLTIDNQTFQVVTACAHRMGSVSSALLTSKLINAFRPRFIAMTGICAGVKEKVNIGDVVLFDPVWEWPSGKLVDGDGGTYLQPSPHQVPIADFIVARAEEMSNDKALWVNIQNSWPAEAPGHILKLVLGPGASGSAVIADSATVPAIKQQHRKVTAVEMEAYGVCAAARSSTSPKPTAIIMKSVCDFADDEKSDKWQHYSSHTSAQGMHVFFNRYLAKIISLAGT
jgi:nucleoside phosphorylase/CheY-like chemotaxis protein